MGRRKTYDREDVLERALDLFWRKGYEGTHLQELVDTTGLNRFSLYKEFGGKEGLFEETIACYLGHLSELSVHLETEPWGVANIRRYFEALVEHEFRHGCFLVNTLSEKHVVGARIFGQVEAVIAEGAELFRGNLEASSERGELTPGTDLDALVRFLVAFELGLLTYSIIEPGRDERHSTLAVLDRVLAAP